MLFSLYQQIKNRTKKPYRFFVCHHKAGAGCFARLMKMQLQDTKGVRGCRVFVDCDDLSNLDKLFDYVGSQTQTLIALCSKELLTRPWCVGELVTCKARSVEVLRVIFEDFAEPTQAFIDSYEQLVP